MPVQPEQILSAILDHSPQNIVLMDPYYKVISFNQRIRETLYIYHKHYIEVGSDYRDFVVPSTMSTFLTAFDLALKGKITEVELDTVGEDYKSWFRYRVNPVYTPDGALIGVSLSAEDISERKNAEQELARSEAKFRSLVEQSSAGVFILSDGQLLYINPALETIMGLDAPEAGRHELADFIHDDDLDLVQEHCRKVAAGENDVAHFTASTIRGDGAVRFWEFSISRIVYNGQGALIGSVVDITERIDEEIRINEAVDQAQEEQRTEIGMELHDNVKQQIASAVLMLRLLMETSGESAPKGAMMEKSVKVLEQSINDLRQLSHRLAPAVDDETGIVEKVQELVARMNVKHNLSVSVEIGAECNALNEHLQVVLYRIIQEQFNNIISYAAAKTVTIRLMKQAGDLLLKIQDDGKGMDLSSKTTGIGLVNIRRRVQILGGSVQIVSAPGKGFSLTAAIPF